ncbi:MAG: OmpA family protein [Chthoniobacteraceae bacterium]|nr:OmpA family protein [Chthoniobacteraceae bacterium]
MFSRRKIPKKDGEGENPFLLTFSDFMASLLAIFILVLIVTLIELEKKKSDLRITFVDLVESLEDIQVLQDEISSSLLGVNQREQALAVILDGIQKDLRSHGIAIVLAENGTVLRIPEQQLQFALGKFEVPSAHTASALAIGRALLRSLSIPENRALLDTVFIEGHTDSVPNPREMGNWGLSTYRAISLWNFWTEKPGELADLKELHTSPADSKTASKRLISVSGYADTRSTHGILDAQMWKNDRSEDRRIDIRFTLVSSEKQSLEGLRERIRQMREKTGFLTEKLKGSGDAIQTK